MNIDENLIDKTLESKPQEKIFLIEALGKMRLSVQMVFYHKGLNI